MKTILYTAIFLVFSTSAFAQTTPTKKTTKLDVKVVNEEDPICGMKTAQFLKDTLTYDKKVYGFCNTRCKETFKKDPKKYVKK